MTTISVIVFSFLPFFFIFSPSAILGPPFCNWCSIAGGVVLLAARECPLAPLGCYFELNYNGHFLFSYLFIYELVVTLLIILLFAEDNKQSNSVCLKKVRFIWAPPRYMSLSLLCPVNDIYSIFIF